MAILSQVSFHSLLQLQTLDYCMSRRRGLWRLDCDPYSQASIKLKANRAIAEAIACPHHQKGLLSHQVHINAHYIYSRNYAKSHYLHVTAISRIMI